MASRIALQDKLAAVAFVFSGFKQTQAAELMKLNPKSVSKWTRDSRINGLALDIAIKAEALRKKKAAARKRYANSPLTKMTFEQRQEMGRKGGLARGANLRAKKAAEEAAMTRSLRRKSRRTSKTA